MTEERINCNKNPSPNCEIWPHDYYLGVLKFFQNLLDESKWYFNYKWNYFLFLPSCPQIPKQRSCRDAEIEPHWCACLIWQNVDIRSSLVRRASTEFVAFLNSYNAKYSDLCETLKLEDIREAAKLLPNKRVLSFKQSYDADGHIPDLTSKVRLSSQVLQVKVRTKPGHGVFEFSTIYDFNADRFTFQVSTF